MQCRDPLIRPLLTTHKEDAMKRRIVWSAVLVFGLVVAIAACSGLQKPVVLEAKKGLRRQR